jgi:hypothetical protein
VEPPEWVLGKDRPIGGFTTGTLRQNPGWYFAARGKFVQGNGFCLLLNRLGLDRETKVGEP